MNIERAWAMPSKNTFSIPPIRQFIETHLVTTEGTVLDLYANEMSISNVISPSTQTYISNDIDPQYNTTYSMDAIELLKSLDDSSVDFVLFDPPFSPRQVSEVYKSLDKTVNMQTTQASFWSKQKKEIARIVKPAGKVITFGWNSGGIGKTQGFEITDILLVAHGGWHNDTICTLEVKN